VTNATLRSLLAGAAIALSVALVAVWRQRAVVHEPAAAPSHVESEPLPPPSPSAPAFPAPASQAASVSAVAPVPLDESALMTRLRDQKDSRVAIELAREGDRRFPGSPAAPERASILIHALASQGRASEARGEAERVVNGYPDSDWVREIEQFTGAHRHRNIRLGDAGVLEYYDPDPP
jgi:hypothetical protein